MNTAFELVSLRQVGHCVLRVATGFDSPEEAERLKQMPLQLDRSAGLPVRWVLRAGSDVVREVEEARVSMFQLSPLILRDFGEPLALLTMYPNCGHVAQPREEGHDLSTFTTLIWLASCVIPVAQTRSQDDDTRQQPAAGENDALKQTSG